MNRLGQLAVKGLVYVAAVVAVLTLAAEVAAQETGTMPEGGRADGDVKMTTQGAFEIHVQGADLRGVLRLLSTQGKKNIVATKEVTGKVTADLYDVTFYQALDAVLRASGFVYEEKDNFIYVYTKEQLEEIRKAERKTDVRTFKLAYLTAQDAQTLITPALSSEGIASGTPAAAVGIATSSTDAGGNSLGTEDVVVVKDYEENLKRIEEILKTLDVRPEQILIEATILRATLTENNALGVDLHVLAGIDFEGLASTSTGVGDMSAGSASGSTLQDPAAGLRTSFSAGVPAGGMSLGFFSNDVAFFIRALESVTDVTVMANPKLLIINKQRGEIMVGNRDGYLTTTVTETVATETVQFLETGTRLVVRPYIARDNYIRLEIHPEDSSGSVSSIGNNVLPSETTTEVTSNVLVRDGRTIVIGGLFREKTSGGRAQIPLLGNIPYLGTLFRRTSDVTEREELIILITPRKIQQDIDEATGEQMKEDAERLRIGQRKGLQWFGRERLAQTHMRWAKKELAAGKPDKALWNVDMALSLEPRMIEAIRMKERLTNRAFWADTAQYSVVKYLLERMIMNELGKPHRRVFPPCKPLDLNKIDPDVRKAFGIRPEPEDPTCDLGAKTKAEVKGGGKAADQEKGSGAASPAAGKGKPK